VNGSSHCALCGKWTTIYHTNWSVPVEKSLCHVCHTILTEKRQKVPAGCVFVWLEKCLGFGCEVQLAY